MICAELKYIRSSDFEVDTVMPDDPEDCSLWIEAGIGTPGDEGGDIFQFEVCTPAWLAREARGNGGVTMGRYRIIVSRWDYHVVRMALDRLCRDTTGKDWEQVATKLARFGLWQFSDYQPYRG